MREKIGKQMLQTSVRKIEYDFMACTRKLFQDFGYCDMSDCVAYFREDRSRRDPHSNLLRR